MQISETVSTNSKPSKAARALHEAMGLVRKPLRIAPLISKIVSDGVSLAMSPRHLYSYSATKVPSADVLQSLIAWILRAQHVDGGIAAYYSFLTGYSDSYPEVTGYIIPTLYDFARMTGDAASISAAERATGWLYSLQMPSGAFPAGLHNSTAATQPSVFNTGQILQGLVRAYIETRSPESLRRAEAAGDWLASVQGPDGAWSGAGAYQGQAHTYYSMVAWALAELAAESGARRHAETADKNIDWVLTHARPSGWIEGINLQGHPSYLHFVAYVIQGVLECGILRKRNDAIAAAERAAWALLRKFETHKRLAGTYETDFRAGQKFACPTGNAQMSCVWLRLYEVTRDLRYLNASLKINELVKQLLPQNSRPELNGGVAGSYPLWGAYQPMRLISWGAKFFADALMLEQRILHEVENGAVAGVPRLEATAPARSEASPCAS